MRKAAGSASSPGRESFGPSRTPQASGLTRYLVDCPAGKGDPVPTILPRSMRFIEFNAGKALSLARGLGLRPFPAIGGPGGPLVGPDPAPAAQAVRRVRGRVAPHARREQHPHRYFSPGAERFFTGRSAGWRCCPFSIAVRRSASSPRISRSSSISSPKQRTS